MCCCVLLCVVVCVDVVCEKASPTNMIRPPTHPSYTFAVRADGPYIHVQVTDCLRGMLVMATMLAMATAIEVRKQAKIK